MTFTKVPVLAKNADRSARIAHHEEVSLIRRINMDLAQAEPVLAVFTIGHAFLLLLAQMNLLRLNLSGKRLTSQRKREIEKAVFQLLNSKLKTWYTSTIETCIAEGNTKEYDANRYFKNTVDYKTSVSANTLLTLGFSVTKEELDVFRTIIIGLLTDEIASRKYLNANPTGLSIWTFLKYGPDERTPQFKGTKISKKTGNIIYPEGSMLNYIETVKSTATNILDMSTKEDDDTTVYENDRRIVSEDTLKSIQNAVGDYNAYVLRFNSKEKNVNKKEFYSFTVPSGLKAKDEFNNWILLCEDPNMPETARNILADALARYEAPRELMITFIINSDATVFESQRILKSHHWGLNDTYTRERDDLPFKSTTPDFSLISTFFSGLSTFDVPESIAADRSTFSVT